MYDVERTHSQLATTQPGGLSALKRSKLLAVPPGPAWASGRRRSSRPRPSCRAAGTRSAAAASCRGPSSVIMLISSRCCSSACGIAILLVSSQSGCTSPALGAVEQVIGTDPRDAVALLSGPGGVALAGVDDGAGEVERECRRLAAARADRAQRHRGVGRRRRRVRVERRDRRRAAQRVPVRGAVVLDRAADDPGAGLRTGVDLQVARSRASCRRRSSPSRPASCLSGRIAIRLPPPLTQPRERRHLRRVERRVPEQHYVESAQERRREKRHVDRRERVQALVAQDLAEVQAERVRRRPHDEHLAAAMPPW